jgi:hypothetical protein
MSNQPPIVEHAQLVKESPVPDLPGVTCFVWEVAWEETDHKANRLTRGYRYDVTFGRTAENSVMLGAWPDLDWSQLVPLGKEHEQARLWIDEHHRPTVSKPIAPLKKGRRTREHDIEQDIDS